MPRLALSRQAPGFIFASSSGPNMFFVDGVSGTCSVTKSEIASTSSSFAISRLLPIGSFAAMS